MREAFERVADQRATFLACHLSDMQRIKVVQVDLDRLRRPAVRQLEDAKRCPPTCRVAVREMRSERLDRGGHELRPRGSPTSPFGLEGVARYPPLPQPLR